MKTQILQVHRTATTAPFSAGWLRGTVILLFFTLLSSVSFGQTKLWDKTFGGNDLEGLNALQQTADGGYILGGYSYSSISGDKTEAPQGTGDFWLVKVDSAGTKQWDKTLGGSGYEELTALYQTRDGGYILGGWSLSPASGDKTEDNKGNFDYWVVKVDQTGRKQWDKTLGGNRVDYLADLQQTEDGGYIVGGWSNSELSGDKSEQPKGIIDFWVVKLDSAGEKQWDRTLGGNESDQLAALQQTSDGGYILGGNSGSEVGGDKTAAPQGGGDFWLVKLDAAGRKVWDQALGGERGEVLNSLQQTRDGGYILGGNSGSDRGGDKSEDGRGLLDYWVVKLDSAGEKVWDKTLGGELQDELNAIGQAADGGYILGGYSLSGISGDKTEPSKADCCCFECPGDFWVIKLDAAGNKEWDKTLGGTADDNIAALQATRDGGYLVGGTSATDTSEDKTEPSRGFGDFWVVKLRDGVQPPPPFFRTFFPQQGLPGSQVTLTGRFLTTASAVSFNGAPAEFRVLSDTSVVATVPDSVTTGPITLVTDGGRVTSRLIYTLEAPFFRTFFPQQGLPGSQVTLTGRFLTTASAVSFNGAPAEFRVLSDTSVVATVPDSVTTGPITLVTDGGRVTSRLIYTLEAPFFRTFFPQQGVPGSQVTLTGRFLTSTSAVSFNGTAAAFRVLSDTSIVTTVPDNATSGLITLVTAGGRVTSRLRYTVQYPALQAFYPHQGKAGTKVLLVGERFRGTKEVRFNNVAAFFKVYFDYLLVAVVPEGATTGNIRVALSNGKQVASRSDFTVLGTSQEDSSGQLARRRAEAPAAALLPARDLLPYPNPFVAEVNIPLELPNQASVQLSIYSQTGQLVYRTTSRTLGAGSQQLQWNGCNTLGQPVASGIYYYRLQVNNKVHSGKLFKAHADR